MYGKLKRVVAFLVLLPGLVTAIPIDKLRGEAYTDLGELVHGDAEGDPMNGYYLTRMGVTLTAADTIQERLLYSVGVGGLFWRPYPPGDFWKNTLHFGPGISEAWTEFRFTRVLGVQGGFFPFKYDPPAMNLGEYLLRTDSYPTFLATGGWTWVDSAHAKALGLRLKATHFGGAFRHELGAYWEYQNPPLFDITPAYLFAWKPAKGLEIGGGAALRRWFASDLAYVTGNADAEAKAGPGGRYVTIANFPEVQNQALVRYSYTDPSGRRVDTSAFAAWRPGEQATSSVALSGKAGVQVAAMDMLQHGSAAGPRSGIQEFLLNAKWSDGTADCYGRKPSPCQALYGEDGNVAVTDASGAPVAGGERAAQVVSSRTFHRSAINLMARIRLDLAEMLELGASTGPFGLYAEWGVLGLQDQPVYFEDVAQRMPIMAGLHVPAFGLLDLLAVEVEYLRNPYRDSERQLAGSTDAPLSELGMAIPDFTQAQYRLPEPPDPAIHEDDWKWSVHAVKTLVPGLQVKLQAANDHMRLPTYEPEPSAQPQTVSKSHWYYLVHVQWGF